MSVRVRAYVRVRATNVRACMYKYLLTPTSGMYV